MELQINIFVLYCIVPCVHHATRHRSLITGLIRLSDSHLTYFCRASKWPHRHGNRLQEAHRRGSGKHMKDEGVVCLCIALSTGSWSSDKVHYMKHVFTCAVVESSRRMHFCLYLGSEI